MKILFPDWASALQAAQDLDIEGCDELIIIHEGSLPYVPEGSTNTHYRGGTGRYFITDKRTGEFVAYVIKYPGSTHKFKPQLRVVA
jgi:hypothetical protein